ncbi:hypothetical protein J6590_012572 [Homalodisca vitripennis]|nr:hypothetical protein J6590_012572 [Homalodisca vitripennis]
MVSLQLIAPTTNFTHPITRKQQFEALGIYTAEVWFPQPTRVMHLWKSLEKCFLVTSSHVSLVSIGLHAHLTYRLADSSYRVIIN